MSSNYYFQHHHALLKELYRHCQQQLPFADKTAASDTDLELLASLKQLSEAEHADVDFEQQGRAAISRIIGQYPHITPMVSRDLLWFFGGDCLHYMGDDELALYQQLDESLFAEGGDDEMEYAKAKARIFGLH